jgi:hypothetical protein
MIGRTIDLLDWKISLPHWEKPHLSTKAGPDGLAMISAFKDIISLPDALQADLMILGGIAFTRYFEIMKALDANLICKLLKLPPAKGIIRKLSIVRSPEGKARIIAILDYWTQTVLKPLHEELFILLAKIKADCTFSQLSHKTLKKGPYYSIDLKNATDRFPLSFQVKVLAAITGSVEYAQA